MKLSDSSAGSRAVIVRLAGDQRFISRVTSIGLTPGCVIEILRNEKRHPILIYGRDTVIAMNRKESERIEIEVKGAANE